MADCGYMGAFSRPLPPTFPAALASSRLTENARFSGGMDLPPDRAMAFRCFAESNAKPLFCFTGASSIYFALIALQWIYGVINLAVSSKELRMWPFKRERISIQCAAIIELLGRPGEWQFGAYHATHRSGVDIWIGNWDLIWACRAEIPGIGVVIRAGNNCRATVDNKALHAAVKAAHETVVMSHFLDTRRPSQRPSMKALDAVLGGVS